MALRIGSLCTGYGGLDLGVQRVLGGSVAWNCEIDPSASAILAYRWPTVPNLGDLSAVDWERVPLVDVLTAGFPCQDVSVAGQRAGIAKGTRSGLWAYVAHAIESLQPRLVVLENVLGLLSASAHSDVEPCTWCVGDASGQPPVRALGAVLGDLARLGFDAEWSSVRASDVGAAHRRERVFVVAWPADSGGPRLAGRWAARATSHCGGSAAADTEGDGWQQGGAEPAGQFGGLDAAECGVPSLADTDRGMRRPQPDAVDWGAYAPAIRRWEHVAGRPAPAPIEPGRTGLPRLSPLFVEWLMGLPTGHVVAVPGLSRTAQLKALGNGVVPQQAAHALRRLLSSVAFQEAA